MAVVVVVISFNCLSFCLSTYLSIYLSVYLQAWKRSYSARLPPFLNLTTSKTQRFSETSSIFELDNVKNEAILRDFLNVRSWQHQKRSNSARRPSKMESWVQSWRPRTNAFLAIFPLHLSNLSKLLRLPRKSDARSYEVLHLSRKIILANLQIWCSKMQPLSGNQRPDMPRPPNISDEHVFCTAPATRNASLQILFKCPTPAIVFGNATEPSRFAHFWKGAQSLAPATRNDIWTSKSGPSMWCF